MDGESVDTSSYSYESSAHSRQYFDKLSHFRPESTGGRSALSASGYNSRRESAGSAGSAGSALADFPSGASILADSSNADYADDDKQRLLNLNLHLQEASLVREKALQKQVQETEAKRDEAQARAKKAEEERDEAQAQARDAEKAREEAHARAEQAEAALAALQQEGAGAAGAAAGAAAGVAAGHAPGQGHAGGVPPAPLQPTPELIVEYVSCTRQECEGKPPRFQGLQDKHKAINSKKRYYKAGKDSADIPAIDGWKTIDEAHSAVLNTVCDDADGIAAFALNKAQKINPSKRYNLSDKAKRALAVLLLVECKLAVLVVKEPPVAEQND